VRLYQTFVKLLATIWKLLQKLMRDSAKYRDLKSYTLESHVYFTLSQDTRLCVRISIA